jgi:hypothetical protein
VTAPRLSLVRPDKRLAPRRAPPRQRARHAPSARYPGWTACGLPPSSRLGGQDTEPPYTCKRCLAVCGEQGP